MFKSIGLYPRVDYGLGKKNAQNGTVRNSNGASAHIGCRGPGIRGTSSWNTSGTYMAGPSPYPIARNGHLSDNKRVWNSLQDREQDHNRECDHEPNGDCRQELARSCNAQ